jgi:poly(glycerol-phosphate) alpha-glucosyltransferase
VDSPLPPAADTSDLSLHFPLNTLALKRGGLVKSVIRRANNLAASGAFAAVWIEVLAFQPRLESDVASLKRSGHLHKAVQVRSVLFSLDPSAPNARAKVPTTTSPDGAQPGPADKAGLVAVQSRTDHLTTRYLRDGVLERSETRETGGDLRFVDHYDAGRRRVRRDEHGTDSRLLRVLHYPATHEQHTVARWIGRDGACYLTVWHEPGEPAWSQVHLLAPRPRQLSEMGELYRYAFEKLLASERSPVLFADFHENLPNLPASNLDDVVRSVQHPGLRTVAMAHSNHHAPPYTPGSGVSANWERLFANLDHWDLLVLLTERQRQDVRERYGNGTRMKVIPPSAETAEATEKSPSLVSVDPDRLVLVARTHPKKRVDEAMRVFRLVLDRRPTARLEIYGFGYKDREARKIDELIDELDVRKHLVFAGFTSRQSEIYDGACLTLMTSASEGFPLVLLESMGHAVPVVAYDACYGPSEAITDGENGYLVPFGDQEAMADRIVSVMESPALRERLGAGALASLARFDINDHVDLWRQALADLDGPPAVRSSLNADYEVQAAGWVNGKLELRVGVPAHSASPQLVVTRRGAGEIQRVPVVAGRASADLDACGPGDIFDFSLATGPETPPRRLIFGSPDVVQQRPYRVYSTAHGSFSVTRLPSIRPGQLPDPELRTALARRLRRGVTSRLRRGLRGFRELRGFRPRR